MVILPQPIICPTMGLGLPILPEWVSPQLSQGQQEGTEVVSRQSASDPQFCLPEPQFFLFSCGDNHIQVIRNRGQTVLVLLDSQDPWSIKWFPFPPTPCPAWKMHLANSFLVLPLSLSVLPLYNHGDCALSGCLPDLVFLKVWPRDHLYQNPLGAVSKRELVSNNIGYNSDLCNQNS